MKLCKDCKHFRRSLMSPFSHDFARCVAPQNMVRTNFVTGKQEGLWYFVEYARAESCGVRDAKWWEAK